MSTILPQRLPPLRASSSIAHTMSNTRTVSFQHVYQEYRDKIYSYVYYRVNNDRDVTEDVVSDIFLKAYRAFDSYNQKYALSTWLYTIARNTLIDHYRTHKDLVDIDSIQTSDETDPLYLLINTNISLSELDDAIASLPEKQARYIRQQFLEGYNAKEIAEAAGTSHVAVRKQISRGLSLIRQKLLSIIVAIGILETYL